MSNDFNSPELFNKGLDVARQQLQTINKLSKSILSGIADAYDEGYDPSQTATQYAELRNLLHNLSDFLQQTGVGASSTGASQSTWNESSAAAAAHDSYARRTRIQENAAVVANLLGSHAPAL